MPDLSDAIDERARANAALGALIGVGAAMLIFPVQAPQKPGQRWLVWADLSAPRHYAGGGYAGITETRVQFNSHSMQSYEDAKAVGTAVKNAFAAFTGAVHAGVTILSMRALGSPTCYFDEATRTYVCAFDELFQWREAA